MASPVGIDHSDSHIFLVEWLSRYRRSMSGTHMRLDATVILGDESEPQPDTDLRYENGASRISGNYCISPPELVVEVSQSTAMRDLVHKRDDYERNGVGEYLVLVVPESRATWFVRGENDGFVELPPSDGDSTIARLSRLMVGRGCVFS